MDDAQARRWLASSFDGTDALTDDLVREAARLLGDRWMRSGLSPKSVRMPLFLRWNGRRNAVRFGMTLCGDTD